MSDPTTTPEPVDTGSVLGDLHALTERVRVLEEALRADDKLLLALNDLAEARGYNPSCQWAVDAKERVNKAQDEYTAARKALSGGGEQHDE